MPIINDLNLDSVYTKAGYTIGVRGSRELLLSLRSNGHLQQEIFLSQTWVANSKEVISNVLVEPGSMFAGTQVRIRELIGVTELRVEIRILGSQRQFLVGSPWDSPVFGSEFTYDDFRFFLPPGTLCATENTASCWLATYPGIRAEHVLCDSYPVPETTQWYDENCNCPYRLVVSTDFQHFPGGVVMPGIMSARRVGETGFDEQSQMQLLRATIET